MKWLNSFKQALSKSKPLTIPNLISLFRLMLAFPIAEAVYYEDLYAVALLGTLAVLSDFLDGYVSRLLNQHSDSGKILDPIVDCVVVLTVLVALYLRQQMPLWYIQLTITRYAIIVVTLAIYRVKYERTPQSVLSGKISIALVASTMGASLIQLQYPSVFNTLLWLSTGLMLISLVDYLRTYA